jgi:hypothetical protein
VRCDIAEAFLRQLGPPPCTCPPAVAPAVEPPRAVVVVTPPVALPVPPPAAPEPQRGWRASPRVEPYPTLVRQLRSFRARTACPEGRIPAPFVRPVVRVPPQPIQNTGPVATNTVTRRIWDPPLPMLVPIPTFSVRLNTQEPPPVTSPPPSFPAGLPTSPLLGGSARTRPFVPRAVSPASPSSSSSSGSSRNTFNVIYLSDEE